MLEPYPQGGAHARITTWAQARRGNLFVAFVALWLKRSTVLDVVLELIACGTIIGYALLPSVGRAFTGIPERER